MQKFDKSDELQLNIATVQFLDAVAKARTLKVTGGRKYLNAYDYVKYLGINLEIEPHLSWIAREMCSAPLPSNCEEVYSESNLIYFKDKDLNVCTLEHPWTQRYLKMLEVHRLEFYAAFPRSIVSILAHDQPTIKLHLEYPELQIACEDCGQCQSTKYCESCVESFCDSCYNLLHHKLGSRSEHVFKVTAGGSDCSVCLVRQPNVFCKSCVDYFCYSCFEIIHKKGKRFEHTVMKIPDGLQGDNTMGNCCACKSSLGNLYCDFCRERFCLSCFWIRHLNGNHRKHTVTSVSLRPLCSVCEATRGSVHCDQCHALFCTNCFTRSHSKGNRKLHIFRDAMNFLLLLDHQAAGGTQKVYQAATRIQAWTRGWQQRSNFEKRRNLAVVIQKRWRGGETRRKLVGMMDQLNWRRRVVLNAVVKEQARHSLAQRYDKEEHPPESETNTPKPVTAVSTRLTEQVKTRKTIRRLFNFLTNLR